MGEQYVTHEQLEQRLRPSATPWPKPLFGEKGVLSHVDFSNKAAAKNDGTDKSPEQNQVHRSTENEVRGALPLTFLALLLMAGSLFFLSFLNIWPNRLGKRGGNG